MDAMRYRSNARRALALFTVVGALATATAVTSNPVGAARVTASGSLVCGAVGKATFKPPLTLTARPGTVTTLRAALGCIAGSDGNPVVRVRSGRIIGTSAPFTATCQSLGIGAVASTIKWKGVGGSITPTVIRWNATASSPSHRSFDLQGTATGSFSGQVMRVHVAGDPATGGLCGQASKRLAFSGAGGASMLTASAPTTTVLFQDQFNGTKLDRTKWRPNWLGASDTTVTKPVNTQEQSCYDPAQVAEGFGVLVLSAVQRLCPANNGITYPYASGMVETAHDFLFTYGRLEARIWVAPGSGTLRNWPAFWADGTGKWPTTGELNVMEGLHGSACWHFHSSSGGPGGCSGIANASGWHTYAADWRAGSVTYFYDGVRVGQLTAGVTSGPMYLVLNLGVSSLQSPPVTLPSQMLVDYVRVTR
jgi:Glycosyl hydrolases family 16